MEPANAKWIDKQRHWQVPTVKLTLVGHFVRADFCRIFGRQFFSSLKEAKQEGQTEIVIRCRKLIEFVERKEQRELPVPVLEYLAKINHMFGLQVEMRDTMFPYGPGSLDSHSRTFLNLAKSEALTQPDKEDMRKTFQQKTADAYGYAMVDAVNTLLVHEQMIQKDRDIYRVFGFTDKKIPTLRATLGSRVSTFLKKTTMRDVVGGGKTLASERSLERLMSKGGLALFKDQPEASKFGKQTGTTHGGLLYSRSPTRFWHESHGMLRDVDMSGCYNNIVAKLNAYWGRPVIFEPGSNGLLLKDAVALVEQHAEPDSWMIRVSGSIGAFPNALIPSTENALTSLNYRQVKRREKRRQTRQRVFALEAGRDDAEAKGTKGSHLYAGCVESGIVTRPTWLMIQALPGKLRKEYEELLADTIIFYPSKLIASNGGQFDELVQQYRNDQLPWEANLDLAGMEVIKREKIDDEFVSLKYPIGHYAKKIGEYRKQAQQTEGKGSGLDMAWKVHANAMYGILASIHLPTNNFVAANQITAWARAEAFAMSQSLNAIQTITDGCTYRLDQIPACSYAECLEIKPDYPIKRAEAGDGIPFIDPAAIPQDDAGFTVWFREHVKGFFGMAGTEFDDLFDTHSLEHKKTGVTKTVAFDALACDGSGNYAKWTDDANGSWQLEDFAARSYRKESKEVLKDWLRDTYSQDCLKELAPITEEKELLSFKKAAQKARKTLDAGVPQVYFPLGLENRRVLNYRAFKPSAFVFGSPQQRASILKQIQKFEEDYATGLEILALRRSYGNRRQGSLNSVAEELYQAIRQGSMNLKTLNLQKPGDGLVKLADERKGLIESKKRMGQYQLQALMDTRCLDPRKLPTAYLVTKEDLQDIKAESDG